MPAFKYAAIIDGKVVGTRTSASQRVYTHAVVSLVDGTPRGIFAWCGRLDLAQKQLAIYTGKLHGAAVIVPVVRTDAAKPAPVSWKVEVQADSTGTWAGNGLRFATQAEAEKYGADLAWRWTAVREWRTVESSDPADREPRTGAGSLD